MEAFSAVNKTRRDKIRNEVIRDMAGAKPVLQHIKQQQIKWFGHITRMPINQPALRAYNTKYSGWRAKGRPRKRWSDSVADTLRTQGMPHLQATRLAPDRQLPPPPPLPSPPLPRRLPVQAEEKSKSKRLSRWLSGMATVSSAAVLGSIPGFAVDLIQVEPYQIGILVASLSGV